MSDPESERDFPATSSPNEPPPALGQSPAWSSAVLAATAGVAASLAARFALALLTPAEIFGDRLTVLIPVPVFSRLLALLGSNAKHVFYAFTLMGQLAVLALLGYLYVEVRQRRVGRHPLTWLDDAIIGLLPWILSAGVLAPVIGGGFLGASLPGGAAGVFLSELAPDAAFALALLASSRREGGRSRDGVAPTASAGNVGRRRFLRDVGFAAAVVAGGALAWDLVSGGLGTLLGLGGPNRPGVNLGNIPERIPPPAPTYARLASVAGQTPEVTPADHFYYVSKNLVSDPGIDATTWRLSINGLVYTPYTLTYDELRSLPAVERYHTLECISNEVGGDLMSNARFTGVSLADVLMRAGIRPGASELVFRAADDYSDSLHLAQALDPRSLVVYLINGQPLPKEHGFPARLLIPGLYGMKNGKWLTSLTVDGGSYAGYWEQRGWTHEALVKPTTRIDVPHDGDLLLAHPLTIAGVAYSSDKGVGRVDVSTDGGETYHPATFHPAILGRPLGPLTWVLWQYAWTPPGPGRYVLIARCIDLQGNVQTAAEAPTLPDGASGYHRLAVVVQ